MLYAAALYLVLTHSALLWMLCQSLKPPTP